jgi:hypothetical protein
VAIEVLLQAGLAARSERTGRYQDPLGGRLIFPIHDPYGQPVAFGGRVLGTTRGPNTSTPRILRLHKGRHLYGLYEGRTDLRNRGQAIVVEGYMDVIGLHQAGASTAVAPLGTALTSDQARLIRRYAQEAVLLFDPDPAGQNASWRSASVFLKEDVFVRVAHVPGGKIRTSSCWIKGSRPWTVCCRRPKTWWIFGWTCWRPPWRGSAICTGGCGGRRNFFVLSPGCPTKLLREEWVQRAAARLSLDAGALRREMARQGGKSAANVRRGGSGTPRGERPAVRTAEEEVLQILAGLGGSGKRARFPTRFFPTRGVCRFFATGAISGRPIGRWTRRRDGSVGGRGWAMAHGAFVGREKFRRSAGGVGAECEKFGTVGSAARARRFGTGGFGYARRTTHPRRK